MVKHEVRDAVKDSVPGNMIGHLLEKARDVFDCDVTLLGDMDSCNAADLNLVGVELLQKKHVVTHLKIYKADVPIACCWQSANK